MKAAVQKNIDFTEGDVWKKLLIFILPILAGNILQQLYVTVDAVIIGKYAGKSGLAAIDSVHALLKLPVLFLTGLSTGATVIISRYCGAKEKTKLQAAVHTAFCFAGCGGVLTGLAGVIGAPLMLDFISVPAGIYDHALSYVRIYFAGFTCMMIYNIGAGILRAAGDSKTPLYVLILSCFINIVLDIIFVAVLKRHTAGAALATTIAQSISAVFTVALLLKSKSGAKLYFTKIRFYAQELKLIIQSGLPIGIQSALYPFANILIQSGINALGTDNIAAWALCGKLDFLIWVSADSIAAAVSVFSAQNHGAQKIGRIKRGTLCGIVLSVCTVSLISIVLYTCSGTLAKLFISQTDHDIIAGTVRIMRFIAPFYVCYAFGDIFDAAIRGSGKTFTAMLVTLITVCGTRIVWMTAVASDGASLRLILLSYPLSWILHSLAFGIYYFIHGKIHAKHTVNV